MSNEIPTFSPDQIAAVFGDADIPVPGQEPEAAPETAKEAPKEEPKPASARIVAAKRAAQRDEQRRQELRQKEEHLTAQAKVVEEKEALAKLLEEDPSKYFEAKKFTPAQIREHLERLAGNFSPEKQTEKKLTGVEQELADLKKALADKETAEKEQFEARRRSEASKNAETGFVKHLEGSLDVYPNLVQEFTTPEEAVNAAYSALQEVIGIDNQGRKITRVAAFIAQHGEPPNDAQIAEYLDGVAKKRIEARANNAWRKRGESVEAGQPQSSGEASRTPPVTGAKPRTLSAKDTSTRATAPTQKWDQDWADAESLRILKEGVTR